MLPSDAIVIILQYAVPASVPSGRERAAFLRTRGLSRAWREAHAELARRQLWPAARRRVLGGVSQRWCLAAAAALFGGDVAELLQWATRDVALLDPSRVRCYGAQFGPPRLMDTGGHPGPAECAELLRFAASAGHMEAVEWLAERFEIYGLHGADLEGSRALAVASEAGHVGVIDRLSRAPFCLDHLCAVGGFEAAARGGSVAALERLLQPPYGAARANCGSDVLQSRAAYFGNAPVLARLLEPPFWVDETTGYLVIHSACMGGGHEVLDRFAHLVDGMPARSRADVLVAACGHPNAAIAVRMLDRLAQPPYCMGHADALLNDGAAYAAVRAVEVLDRLGRAPYAPPGPLPNAGRVLERCVCHGCTRMLDRVALPPFSLDHRSVSGHLLEMAAERGVLRRLEQPPFAEPSSP